MAAATSLNRTKPHAALPEFRLSLPEILKVLPDGEQLHEPLRKFGIRPPEEDETQIAKNASRIRFDEGVFVQRSMAKGRNADEEERDALPSLLRLEDAQSYILSCILGKPQDLLYLVSNWRERSRKRIYQNEQTSLLSDTDASLLFIATVRDDASLDSSVPPLVWRSVEAKFKREIGQLYQQYLCVAATGMWALTETSTVWVPPTIDSLQLEKPPPLSRVRQFSATSPLRMRESGSLDDTADSGCGGLDGTLTGISPVRHRDNGEADADVTRSARSPREKAPDALGDRVGIAAVEDTPLLLGPPLVLPPVMKAILKQRHNDRKGRMSAEEIRFMVRLFLACVSPLPLPLLGIWLEDATHMLTSAIVTAPLGNQAKKSGESKSIDEPAGRRDADKAATTILNGVFSMTSSISSPEEQREDTHDGVVGRCVDWRFFLLHVLRGASMHDFEKRRQVLNEIQLIPSWDLAAEDAAADAQDKRRRCNSNTNNDQRGAANLAATVVVREHLPPNALNSVKMEYLARLGLFSLLESHTSSSSTAGEKGGVGEGKGKGVGTTRGGAIWSLMLDDGGYVNTSADEDDSKNKRKKKVSGGEGTKLLDCHQEGADGPTHFHHANVVVEVKLDHGVVTGAYVPDLNLFIMASLNQELYGYTIRENTTAVALRETTSNLQNSSSKSTGGTNSVMAVTRSSSATPAHLVGLLPETSSAAADSSLVNSSRPLYAVELQHTTSFPHDAVACLYCPMQRMLFISTINGKVITIPLRNLRPENVDMRGTIGGWGVPAHVVCVRHQGPPTSPSMGSTPGALSASVVFGTSTKNPDAMPFSQFNVQDPIIALATVPKFSRLICGSLSAAIVSVKGGAVDGVLPGEDERPGGVLSVLSMPDVHMIASSGHSTCIYLWSMAFPHTCDEPSNRGDRYHHKVSRTPHDRVTRTKHCSASRSSLLVGKLKDSSHPHVSPIVYLWRPSMETTPPDCHREASIFLDRLLSVDIAGTVKVWDLNLQCCVATCTQRTPMILHSCQVVVGSTRRRREFLAAQSVLSKPKDSRQSTTSLEGSIQLLRASIPNNNKTELGSILINDPAHGHRRGSTVRFVEGHDTVNCNRLSVVEGLRELVASGSTPKDLHQDFDENLLQTQKPEDDEAGNEQAEAPKLPIDIRVKLCGLNVTAFRLEVHEVAVRLNTSGFFDSSDDKVQEIVVGGATSEAIAEQKQLLITERNARSRKIGAPNSRVISSSIDSGLLSHEHKYGRNLIHEGYSFGTETSIGKLATTNIARQASIVFSSSIGSFISVINDTVIVIDGKTKEIEGRYSGLCEKYVGGRSHFVGTAEDAQETQSVSNRPPSRPASSVSKKMPSVVVTAMALSDENRVLYLGCEGGSDVIAVSVATGSVQARLHLHSHPAVARQRMGFPTAILAIPLTDSNEQLLAAAASRANKTLSAPQSPISSSTSPAERATSVIVGTSTGVMALFTTSPGVGAGSSSGSVTADKTGGGVMSMDERATAELLTPTHQITASHCGITRFAWHSISRVIAVGDAEGNLTQWEMFSNQLAKSTSLRQPPIRFSPQSRQQLHSSSYQSIAPLQRLADVASRKPVDDRNAEGDSEGTIALIAKITHAQHKLLDGESSQDQGISGETPAPQHSTHVNVQQINLGTDQHLYSLFSGEGKQEITAIASLAPFFGFVVGDSSGKCKVWTTAPYDEAVVLFEWTPRVDKHLVDRGVPIPTGLVVETHFIELPHDTPINTLFAEGGTTFEHHKITHPTTFLHIVDDQGAYSRWSLTEALARSGLAFDAPLSCDPMSADTTVPATKKMLLGPQSVGKVRLINAAQLIRKSNKQNNPPSLATSAVSILKAARERAAKRRRFVSDLLQSGDGSGVADPVDLQSRFPSLSARMLLSADSPAVSIQLVCTPMDGPLLIVGLGVGDSILLRPVAFEDVSTQAAGISLDGPAHHRTGRCLLYGSLFPLQAKRGQVFEAAAAADAPGLGGSGGRSMSAVADMGDLAASHMTAAMGEGSNLAGSQSAALQPVNNELSRALLARNLGERTSNVARAVVGVTQHRQLPAPPGTPTHAIDIHSRHSVVPASSPGHASAHRALPLNEWFLPRQSTLSGVVSPEAPSQRQMTAAMETPSSSFRSFNPAVGLTEITEVSTVLMDESLNCSPQYKHSKDVAMYLLSVRDRLEGIVGIHGDSFNFKQFAPPAKFFAPQVMAALSTPPASTFGGDAGMVAKEDNIPIDLVRPEVARLLTSYSRCGNGLRGDKDDDYADVEAGIFTVKTDRKLYNSINQLQQRQSESALNTTLGGPHTKDRSSSSITQVTGTLGRREATHIGRHDLHVHPSSLMPPATAVEHTETERNEEVNANAPVPAALSYFRIKVPAENSARHGDAPCVQLSSLLPPQRSGVHSGCHRPLRDSQKDHYGRPSSASTPSFIHKVLNGREQDVVITSVGGGSGDQMALGPSKISHIDKLAPPMLSAKLVKAGRISPILPQGDEPSHSDLEHLKNPLLLRQRLTPTANGTSCLKQSGELLRQTKRRPNSASVAGRLRAESANRKRATINMHLSFQT